MIKQQWCVWIQCLCLIIFTPLSQAHEFWIEPLRYKLDEPGNIRANIRVGQYFYGDTYPYLPHKFAEFSLVDSNGKRPLKGRMGDLPAVNTASGATGLNILVHQSTITTLRYPNFEKFTGFLNKEGLSWVIDRHKQRGLAKKNFKEAYRRYAKSLIRVGDTGGKDLAVGLPLELILSIDPYDATLHEDIPVLLLWNGVGLANTQISVFNKFIDQDSTRSIWRTDASGRVLIPRGFGGDFLLSAVHMIEPGEEAASNGAVWESLWASTTFRLPDSRPESMRPAPDRSIKRQDK